MELRPAKSSNEATHSTDAALGEVPEDGALREAIRRDQELSSGSAAGRTHDEVLKAARRSIKCA
jgi:hypothetical protein